MAKLTLKGPPVDCAKVIIRLVQELGEVEIGESELSPEDYQALQSYLYARRYIIRYDYDAGGLVARRL